MKKRIVAMIMTLVMIAAVTTVASAAKPVKTFTVVVNNVTPTNVTFTVSWNKIGAYKCYAYASAKTDTGGYQGIAMSTIYDGKRLASYETTATLTFGSGQTYPSDFILSGRLFHVYAYLIDRTGNSIEYAESVWGTIP